MKILFMCVANSARSQLAEAIAKQVFGSRAEIYSAGSRPTTLNPFAVRAIDEVGADFRSLWSKSVDDLPKEFVQDLDYVVTLCAEEVCPVIISKAKKLHWPLPDPAGQEGSDDEQMTRFRHTRDEIRKRLEIFSREIS
jgi:arsenate reductase